MSTSMENLEEYEIQTLFESLNRVLRNQNKILMDLEQNGYKPHLNETNILSNRCFGIAQKYQNFIEKINEDENSTEDDENKEPMTKQEIIEYLESTGLYKNTESDMYYEKKMLDENKTVPIRDLVERFIDVDKEFTGKPWNIMQILKNIDMVIPLEDRK